MIVAFPGHINLSIWGDQTCNCNSVTFPKLLHVIAVDMIRKRYEARRFVLIP